MNQTHQNTIYLEYGQGFLTDEELIALINELKTNSIELVAGPGEFEPKACFFDIIIFINDCLSNEIVQQALPVVAYDLFKASLSQILKALWGKVSIRQGRQKRPVKPCVKLNFKDDEANILIPAGLEDREFETFLEAALTVIREEQQRPMTRQRSHYFVYLDNESNEPKLMTGIQYAKKQAEEHHALSSK